MVETVNITIAPEVLDLYPPPEPFMEMWKSGLLYSHQYAALLTDETKARIHSPTASGKSRAATFFSVSPFHRKKINRISATFVYPTNILTDQQFERSLVEGLVQNLGYGDAQTGVWKYREDDDFGIEYKKLRIPEGGDLVIAKLTGELASGILQAETRIKKGKADILHSFIDYLNEGHSFLICSPDLLAYATHEMYGSSSHFYSNSIKKELHSILRGRTLVIDEYHYYDPFSLINLERILSERNLAPARILLLSATGRVDYFPEVPATPISVDLPPPEGKHLASRELTVTFHFNERIPIPEPQNGGVAMYIHESVVENRIRCSYLRSRGVDVIQWDGTRKDLVKENEIGTLHNLICGTSAVEVGLDAPIDSVFTEWNLPWTSVSREIQRIGRAGRRSSSIPATVHIYVPGTIEVFQQEISKLGGHKMTKSELSLELMKAYHMIQDETLRRSNYVSYYYFNGKDDLVRNGYLESYDELKYSFRPPGSVALFLDENERGAIPFIYDKVSILNRYDTRSPIPEDYERINPGMKRFAAGLGINLDQNDLNQDFLVIRGLRETRDYRKIPDGTLGDLRSDRRRKYYVK